jgi:hypothetical protein
MAFRTSLALLVAMPLLVACGPAPDQPATPLADRSVQDSAPRGGDRVQPDETTAAEVVDPAPARVAPATPAAAPPVLDDIHGRWAESQALCADQATTITPTTFEDRDGICQVSEFVPSGDGFTATLSCQVGGASESRLARLRPQNGTLAISYLADDAGERVLQRCLAPQTDP